MYELNPSKVFPIEVGGGATVPCDFENNGSGMRYPVCELAFPAAGTRVTCYKDLLIDTATNRVRDGCDCK